MLLQILQVPYHWLVEPLLVELRVDLNDNRNSYVVVVVAAHSLLCFLALGLLDALAALHFQVMPLELIDLLIHAGVVPGRGNHHSRHEAGLTDLPDHLFELMVSSRQVEDLNFSF